MRFIYINMIIIFLFTIKTIIDLIKMSITSNVYLMDRTLLLPANNAHYIEKL